jgi:hypothetical protein
MTTIRSVSEARRTLWRHQLMLDQVDQAEYEGKPFSHAHRLWLMKQIQELRAFLDKRKTRMAA